ncbi:GNAT family N-acetyltransferase [Halobacillus hunanensis]|uniref:GNAT family N-acetyltransferase n=1 Tax=Halobacillus hunanensis TaxID=578214 RepID=UPI0009A7E948|nr:GNAT family N-acetyltransferase [Halobacillus hunanensis]
MKENALNRSNLYKKVKFVEGENFTIVENLTHLSTGQLLKLLDYLVHDVRFHQAATLSILLPSPSVVVEEKLGKLGFTLHDVTVSVKRDLSDMAPPEEPFTLRVLEEGMEESFKQVWSQSMEGSLNASSSLTMDEQFNSVEKELGPNYRHTCQMVYEGAKPIGVVMPHIEPGTTGEGRLFYFGLIPEKRGKGKSRALHRQALSVLRDEFNADYYMGSTSYRNEPMLKVFDYNGCHEVDRSNLYERKMR